MDMPTMPAACKYGQSHHGWPPGTISECVWCERDRLAAENAALKAKFGFTYCAYCGEQQAIDAPDATEAIGRHIAICSKHPMRVVEAEVAALRDWRTDIMSVLCVAHPGGLRYDEAPRVLLADLEKLAAAEAAQQWRTMESAPKDGTPIQLRRATNVTAGCFVSLYFDATGEHDYVEYWFTLDGSAISDDNFTGWLPLSAPRGER